jgi:hypothetical protein
MEEGKLQLYKNCIENLTGLEILTAYSECAKRGEEPTWKEALETHGLKKLRKLAKSDSRLWELSGKLDELIQQQNS